MEVDLGESLRQSVLQYEGMTFQENGTVLAPIFSGGALMQEFVMRRGSKSATVWLEEEDTCWLRLSDDDGTIYQDEIPVTHAASPVAELVEAFLLQEGKRARNWRREKGLRLENGRVDWFIPRLH